MNLFAGVYTQGLVKFEEDRPKYASALQGLTLSLVIFWIIIYICFREFWNQVFTLSTEKMLMMLFLIWTSSVFNFWAAEQRVNYRYKLLVLVTIFVSIAKPVLGIILVKVSKDKVTARIFGLLVVEAIAYAWMFMNQMKRGKVFFDKHYWKYAVSFNLPLIPHYLSQIVLNNSDRLMIDSIVGASAAGIYSLAYSISQLMTLFNTALLHTLEPWIYTKIKEKQFEKIAPIAYLSMLGIAAVNLILISTAPEIVRFFAPSEYLDAIWVMPPIIMSVFFMFTYSFFASFEFYFEETSFITAASIGGAVLNVILNKIFIEFCGYYAAGYTTLICYMLYALGHYYFMRKICKKYLNDIKIYNTKILLLIAGLFMICGFLIMFLYSKNIVRYLFIIALAVIGIINYKKMIRIAKKL